MRDRRRHGLPEATLWLAPAPTRHQVPVDVHLLLRRDGDEDFARCLAAHADGLPHPERVFTHGGLHPRNLLLGASDGLYVIDFERAQPGPAVRDFVRLTDVWAGRPDLLEGLIDGYGRPFTPAELEYLAVLEALDAVSGVQFGAAVGDLELLERGLRTLPRLRTAAGDPVPGREGEA